MATKNSKNKYKGDIYFYWLNKHPEFFWNTGHVAMLSQSFIDDYQLLEQGYGRILSRGKAIFKVEFLKKHPDLPHEKGKITSLTLTQIYDLSLVGNGYVRLIFEELPPVKEVHEKDKINVRKVKPGGYRAESVGTVFRVSNEEAKRLLKNGFIEILPDSYTTPNEQRPVYKESDFASVVCNKHHPEFSYFQGETGKILKAKLRPLLENGYFDLAPSYSSTERNRILSELGFVLDPVNDNIIRHP